MGCRFGHFAIKD